MENTIDKAYFLQNEYTKKIAQIPVDTTPKWGKMNVQQMIEHMSDYMRIANGRTPMEIVTDAEMIPRMHAFLASDKPFKENTPNVLMSDTPPPVRNESHEAAIAELQSEVDHFILVHTTEPDTTHANPFFGALNFEQQLQLLYKHSTHHLRQFGVE
jgi:hypothetical protein